MAMEFVDAVRFLYDLANGMEERADPEDAPERQYRAGEQSHALNLVFDWLDANDRTMRDA
jgi:hypothetical protein